jgi:NADH-quinone oxidoreductase subunit L
MFRLWFMTFAGAPRDPHRYDHAHESPKVMYVPLVVLAVMAVAAGWSAFGFGVEPLLEQARPAGILSEAHGVLMTGLVHPNEHQSHLAQFHVPSTWVAISTAMAGFLLAVVFYGLRILDPAEVRNQFSAVYTFLINKWYFDELYNVLFVQPVMFVSRRVAEFDRKVIDGLINNLALGTRMIAVFDDLIDRYLVDGFVNAFAKWTYGIALWSRGAETGQIRQYVMFIVVGTVALFVLITFYLSATFAGP